MINCCIEARVKREKAALNAQESPDGKQYDPKIISTIF